MTGSRLDCSLIDGMLKGERTTDLVDYILYNSPLHPDDIDHFVRKVVEILYNVQSPEIKTEVISFLQPIWAFVSNNKIGAEKAKCLLIPLLLLGSDKEYGLANLNWIFHIINILLHEVNSLDDILEDSSVKNAVQNLDQILVDTGDYETQMLMVEAMFYISRRVTCETWAKHWFPDQDAFDVFTKFDKSNFEIGSRTLLNNLNQASDKQKVFSVIAQSVIFGESEVQKAPGQKLWVNFNFGSKCISFYCVCPSELQKVQDNSEVFWDTILIYADNVDTSLLKAFPRSGLQELVIKLNSSCASLIKASENGPIKGKVVHFYFEDCLDIQTYVTAIFGKVFQNLHIPRMESLDITCEQSKSHIEDTVQTAVNGKTNNSKCKASETAAVIHIGGTSNNTDVSSRKSLGWAAADDKLHSEEMDRNDMSAGSGCSNSKASQTATAIHIGPTVNRVTTNDESFDLDAENKMPHDQKVERTYMKEASGCSSSKASRTAASIPIGKILSNAEVQNVGLNGGTVKSNIYGLLPGKASVNGECSLNSVSHQKASQSETYIAINAGQNRSSTVSQVQSNRYSSLGGKAIVNGESSLNSVSQHKVSQSAISIALGGVAHDSKVVKCPVFPTRNHRYVRQIKLNDAIFEQSPSNLSGSVMSSPLSEEEQPENSKTGSPEHISACPKASVSSVLKIFHYPRTPEEPTSPMKSKTNEASHGQAANLLQQMTSSEIPDTCNVSPQKVVEDESSMQIDVVPVKSSEQLEEQIEILQFPENANASFVEKNNTVNMSTLCDPIKTSVEGTVQLQKDILLECSQVVSLETENVNKVKKKTIQKKQSDVQLETDVLLECTPTNVFGKENNTLCNEISEVRPKKHKLFSNNSRVNTELLLNNTTVIEENVTKHAKLTYLENISKRQNAKRNKLKNKSTLSSKVQHDNSFVEVEGVHSKVPQTHLSDVLTKGNTKGNKTDLEKTDSKKIPAAVPLPEHSPEMNFDRTSISKSGIEDSGIGTSVSAEKGSSAGEIETASKTQKKLKRKTPKLEDKSLNDSRCTGRRSRKAALDSIKKTQKIMKYSEETSSVECSLHELSDSGVFTPEKKKKGENVSKQSRHKNIYSLSGSDVDSECSSSNRRSEVSMFESPVKSYKEWRQKKRLRRKTNTKSKEKDRAYKKARHSEVNSLSTRRMKSYSNEVSKTYTSTKQKGIKKNVLFDFDSLLDKTADLSDAESFNLVVERSSPKNQKIKLPKSPGEDSELPMWSPFKRTENISKNTETSKNLGSITSLQDSHRIYSEKNKVKSGSLMPSSQFHMQSTNSEQQKQTVWEIKNIKNTNNMQKIIVEADIEDPKEKLKLLRKRYYATHKPGNQKARAESPYNDQINFIEVETLRGNIGVDAVNNGSIPSTLKNEGLSVVETSSESSVVELMPEKGKNLKTHQQAAWSYGNNVNCCLNDSELSDMYSGKKYHMKRYLMDVVACRSPLKSPQVGTKPDIDLSGKSVLSDLRSELKRKHLDFSKETQASNSKVMKLSHPRSLEKPAQSIAVSQKGPPISDVDIHSTDKTSEKISGISKPKSVVQDILEKYTKKTAKRETSGSTSLDNSQDASFNEQKCDVHHSSATGDSFIFPVLFTNIPPEFKNEDKVQDIPTPSEEDDSVISAIQPPILEKAFGEIIKLSKKYVISVQKYNDHFCKQLSEHRKSMAASFSRDEFISNTRPCFKKIVDDPIKMSKLLRENLNNYLENLRCILDSTQEAEENFETTLKGMQGRVASKYYSSIEEIVVKTQEELERKILNGVRQHLSKFDLDYYLQD